MERATSNPHKSPFIAHLMRMSFYDKKKTLIVFDKICINSNWLN